MHTQLRTILRQTSALTSIAAIGVLFTQPVLANPLGGDVVSGAATISTPDPSTTLINQSTDRAVINWDSFDIGEGELTQFDLPSADSWTLNRVVGSQSPSSIQGAMISNGNIVIVNPDGIHFGPGSTVDVNRLIASTADITNDNFMAGQLDFGIAGNPNASIVNEGVITAADYGLAALVAPSVRNSGVIMARLGTVGLSAGNSFTIDPYGDGLIKLAIGDEIAGEVFDVATGEAVSDLVSNDGTLSADGGTVAMTAATARQAVNSVVNNTGIVEARSVGMQNGMIVLGGSTAATKPAEAPAQVVRVSGTLDASGTNELYPLGTPVTGGEIEMTGEAIIASGATIDASGTNGGGTVLVGGDYLGGNVEAQEALAQGVVLEDRTIETAALVVLDGGTSITADAAEDGDGGKIIVWSDGITSTSAEITARGGAATGNGGFIETSGSYLDLRRSADASAANGEVGTWLIDPFNITIDTSPNGTFDGLDDIPLDDVGAFSNLFDFIGEPLPDGRLVVPTSFDTVLDVSLIENALNLGTSVVVLTAGIPGEGDGDITLATDISKTSGGDAALVLNAAGSVEIESGVDITSTSGRLWVALQAEEGSISAINVGEFDLNGGGLALIAEDNITLSSNFDMPNLAIEVMPNGGGSRAVAIQFDDDQIAFGYNDDIALFPSSAIQLVNDGISSGVLINVLGLDVITENLAVLNETGRVWEIAGVNSWSVPEADALDEVPEIVGGFQINGYPLNEPPTSLVPVIEVSNDFNNSVDDYEISSLAGMEILEAYLASLNPPVEPPTPPVEPPTPPVEPPTPPIVEPIQPEQVILDPSLNVPNIFQQYDEPIGPVQQVSTSWGDQYGLSALDMYYYDQYDNVINGDAQVQRLEQTIGDTFMSSVAANYLLFLDTQLSVSDRLNAIEFILRTLAAQSEVDYDNLRILNYGRNTNQFWNPSYLDDVGGEGWTLLSSSQSAFHAIGMDGETVEKWIAEDGREYVFVIEQGQPQLVIDGINDGTFNFGPDPTSAEHVLLDILPWILWGAGPDDTLSPAGRLELNDEAFRPGVLEAFLNLDILGQPLLIPTVR